MLPDRLVQEGLGVGRLVPFVVPVAPVSDEVDDDVVPVRLSVGQRGAGGVNARLRIVGVDVDDRKIVPPGQVGGVARRAAVGGVGREPDLVVHDDVDRSSHGVSPQARQIERFRHDALRGEGGVAVQQDRHHRLGVLPRVLPLSRELAGPGDALGHGVDELEMARIGEERDRNLRPVGKAVASLGPVVVLHVPGPGVGEIEASPPLRPALELHEDVAVVDAHDVGEHVDPAPVRHAEDDFAGAGLLDGAVQHRNQHVRSLDGEALLAEVGSMKEALQPLDLREPRQQLPLLLRAQGGVRALLLEVAPEPLDLLRLLQVLEVVADGPAVGPPKAPDGLRQRLVPGVVEDDGERNLLQLLERGPEEGGVELRMSGRLLSQRVDPRDLVAVLPVRLDERGGAGHDRKEAAQRFHLGAERLDRRRFRGGRARRGRGERSRRRGWSTRPGSRRGRARPRRTPRPPAVLQSVGNLQALLHGGAGSPREEFAPLGGEGVRIGGEAFVELLHVRRVRSVEDDLGHASLLFVAVILWRAEPPAGSS